MAYEGLFKNWKIETPESIMAEFPHLTMEEALFVAENNNIGNMVAVPRTGIGTGNGHYCFGPDCICGHGKEVGNTYHTVKHNKDQLQWVKLYQSLYL